MAVYKGGLWRVFYTSNSPITITLTPLSPQYAEYMGYFSVLGGSYNVSTAEPDGHYTADLVISYGTSPIFGDTNLVPGEGGIAHLDYYVRNGQVIPLYTPVTCNFLRLGPDDSGLSSGSTILHAYEQMKPGLSGSKNTTLIFACDDNSAKVTATLNKTAITVNATPGLTVSTSKEVLNNSTGAVTLYLYAAPGPQSNPTKISDKEFAVTVGSTVTAKSAGSITYPDILVINYD
ncbi:hypothetical protein KTK71_004691 [Salmonella enterica]|nr:hypothetical protein [Salmonella enterica]EHQ9355136.1 hypothetical protein [Salmonella enterica]EHR1671156.1 hypothetical protein [Salmonella enterica]EHR8097451.1 hypothetical protein [Salmonella enterica]EIE9498828.1 hypothetical protein [Salmonella enterica]